MTEHNWGHLVQNMPNLLAPTMAKDHPNLPVVKEEGCYYYGLDGKKYLDFTSGIAVTNTGHRHPKVVQAIKDAADSLLHGPSGVIMYESLLRLAERLIEIMPGGLDCFFFANSGTEAIEGAIKLAKHVTRRPYVVSFTGCFHGRSLGALSVTTSKSKYRKFLQPNGLTYQIPYAQPKECPPGQDVEQYCVEKLEKDVAALFKHQVTPEEVACFILEPVLGEGGYVVPPQAWLRKIREICDEHGILLIFDEVQTGFGRTGDWFAAQTFGVTPDIMAIAKGIASGLPLSATVASKELMKQWPLGSHGTTFGGNPVACAAALATLDVFREERLLDNCREVGSYARARLDALKEKHPVIGDIRSVGLMIGIEIIDPRTGEPNGDGLMNILNR
ncbi:aspartate aminotransferase family protein, partial [Aneurinibacillus sp. UBA3580]|uniref:aspartate aminotransferase family protein n=1 Tax=Aneurinibacillus sp. UBA3580 TaxID=1946041 RepID=UPI00257D390F